MGADSVYAGRPFIQNGIVVGGILATGKVAWSSTYDKGNYWNLHPNDYSYIRWLAGDNDYYYGLDRDTQLRLRQRLLSGYMNEQISAGFPDFWDGVLWGITLTSFGKKNKATTGTSKLVNSNNPNDYLNAALKRQNLNKAPNNFKEKWSQDGFDYEVRIHAADLSYDKTGSIYRVSRRQQGMKPGSNQGYGWEYLGSDGKWYHTSVLKSGNDTAAKQLIYN
ncbi:hypothetical protein [Paenibacillus oenotherae]|uniref:hypothetical protein n=1 Tax=Paenibacillus oenotherae TaxID=1435645 RepID=UPI001FE388BE|nr:hypothetical protein [Paenibacillus oenotherae]